MPVQDIKKALSDGLISQKQADKLPEKLLYAIIKSKRSGGGKKKKAKAKKPKAKKPKAKKGKKST